MVSIVLRQTVIMFIYMMIGFFLFKKGLISETVSKGMANCCIYVFFPCCIISSYLRQYSSQVLSYFIKGSGICILGIAVSVVISSFFYRKKPVENYASSFANVGFFGFPLVSAIFGPEAVIYVTGCSVIVGILQHTYGVYLITNDRKYCSPKSVLFAPYTIAFLLGLILFCCNIGDKLPVVISGTITTLGNVNAPVIMIVLGVYIAKSNLVSLFTKPVLYRICVVRLILIPAVTALLFALIPFDKTIIMPAFVVLSTACGTNVAVYCQLHNKDYTYACQIVSITTILSIVTIPLVCMFAELLIN